MSLTTNKNVNFKSQIKANEHYKSAILSAKSDIKNPETRNRGLSTLKAIESIRHDGQHDFIEFVHEGPIVRTKVNGKVKKVATSGKSTGKAIQDAIIDFALLKGVYSNKPIFPSEEKVIRLQKELQKAEQAMCKDLEKKIDLYY